MAAVVATVFVFGNGASLSYTFDDVTGAVLSATWENPSGESWTVTFRNNGGQTHTRTITPSTGGTVALPKNRFAMQQARSLNGGMEWTPTFSVSMGG